MKKKSLSSATESCKKKKRRNKGKRLTRKCDVGRLQELFAVLRRCMCAVLCCAVLCWIGECSLCCAGVWGSGCQVPEPQWAWQVPHLHRWPGEDCATAAEPVWSAGASRECRAGLAGQRWPQTQGELWNWMGMGALRVMGGGGGSFYILWFSCRSRQSTLLGRQLHPLRLLSEGHQLKSPLVLVFHFSLQKLETVCVWL